MNWACDNPDRNFSAGRRMDDQEAQALRDLLKSTDIADMSEAVVRRRIGEAIGRAVFDPNKQQW